MLKFLNLKIFSPHKVIMEEQIKRVTFEDGGGALTILPRHQDYVGSFKTHIMSYVKMSGERNFAILSDGVLVKSGENVRFSVFSAVLGKSLEELKGKVGGLDKAKLNIKSDKEQRIGENLEALIREIED